MTVTVWNSADKTGNLVLSSGDTVANVSSTDGSHQGVRANVSKNSASGGKWMIGFRDVQFNETTSPDPFDWVGLILTDTDDITLTRANGSFLQIVLMQFGHSFNGDSTHADSGSHNEFTDFSAITGPCDIDLAVDFDNKKYWFRVSNQNGNAWSNSGDPAANTGGHTILADATFFPATRLTFSGSTTQNCRIDGVPGNLPSGFSTWGTPQTGLIVTETPDTFSAVGYVNFPGVYGSLTTTEVQDTFAAAGYQPVSGPLRVTEAPDIFSAFGRQPQTIQLTITEAPDRVHFIGVGRGEDGTFITTELPDIVAFAGIVPIAGSLITTENPDRFSAIGSGVLTTRKRRTFFVS